MPQGAQAMESTAPLDETEEQINASTSYTPEEKQAKVERFNMNILKSL